MKQAVFIVDYIKEDTSIPSGIIALIVVIIALIGIIGAIASSKMVNAVKYSNLIEIEEGNFGDEIQSISTVEEARDFPLLDVQTAQKLGNRSLSEIDKVSQFEVNGEYNLISYEDKQYRLSPPVIQKSCGVFHRTFVNNKKHRNSKNN